MVTIWCQSGVPVSAPHAHLVGWSQLLLVRTPSPHRFQGCSNGAVMVHRTATPDTRCLADLPWAFLQHYMLQATHANRRAVVEAAEKHLPLLLQAIRATGSAMVARPLGLDHLKVRICEVAPQMAPGVQYKNACPWVLQCACTALVHWLHARRSATLLSYSGHGTYT
jgi:hypothetical protein